MRIQTLKTKQDFDRVYKNAKKFYSKYFTLYFLGHSDKNFFLGLSVSKKVGIACKRNLIKRRFRGLCHLYIENLVGISLVIVPKQGILELSFKEIEKDFLRGLKFFNKYRSA
ncbi:MULTISPECIES: ribonuclease P protein component [unclassified Helicobacter]|uniref:ribonuclease P protein component n=1 Tax=unclassified Helicobacter TaxID=2593540 RepID=UPI000CF0E765|nr:MULTISPECIES: ribonuclease P protein component [unclassified Helicobacter]